MALIEDFPHQLLKFLDPTIEYIRFEKDTDEAIIKFYDRKPIHLTNPLLFEKYLSSGTIKGITVFISAILAFKDGGYLIIDELEKHFNREIVATLLRFFMDQSVNNKGATLVFSTVFVETPICFAIISDAFPFSPDVCPLPFSKLKLATASKRA